MNFTEAVNEVLSIVKRPDKMLDIRRQVNAAVNKFCMDADFKKDVAEISVPIVPTEYSQLIAFASLPRFRKLQYIKRINTTEYLSELNPGRLPQKDCISDTYYEAGTGLRINQSKLVASMDIAYWQYPPTLTDALDNNTHWMLSMAPYMIVDQAAGVIFSNIGDDTSARQHKGEAREAYLILRSDQKSIG